MNITVNSEHVTKSKLQIFEIIPVDYPISESHKSLSSMYASWNGIFFNVVVLNKVTAPHDGSVAFDMRLIDSESLHATSRAKVSAKIDLKMMVDDEWSYVLAISSVSAVSVFISA